ncbi:MAG: hypothetical protein AMXMBFR13_40710 [Phycisphaerae bacterium]
MGFWLASSLQAAWPPAGPLPALPEQVLADVEVYPHVVVRQVSPQLVGTNLTSGGADKKQVTEHATLTRVMEMGMQTVRFPNGCLADLYNWQKPATGQMTVTEFLDFCDAIGAEAYYTLNMQGGTEGLEGAPPADAPLAERIRYRHTAPNPCGYINYYHGTLAETIALLREHTIARALAGKRPLTHFELGNENWGQAKTDWPPEVYGATCEAYVRAMIETLADAQTRYPELTEVGLYVVIVGYPSMGNNQDPSQAVDRQINLAWTKEVNRLADLGLIEAVQEHFYTYGNNNGDALIWNAHNLVNILSLRHGIPNPRLGGYTDEDLEYHLPVEWTEWNVKCWGKRPDDRLPVTNGGFESDLDGWTVEVKPAGTGAAVVKPEAARRGSGGVELITGADGKAVEIRQVFPVKNRLPAATFGAALWVKTDYPLQLHAILRQANEGPDQGAILGQTVATQTNMWERLVFSGAPKAGTTEYELVIRLKGKKIRAWVDEVQFIRWETLQGSMPLVADRFEQQLHNVDALRTLLEWPTPRTHYHHLFGNYPCGQLQADGRERPNAYPFKLLAERIGPKLVKTHVSVPEFAYATPATWSTDFSGGTPSTSHIPALAATTTRDETDIYMILVNRTSDRPIQTRIHVRASVLGTVGDVRTLVGEDIDVPGAAIEAAPLSVGKPLVHTVPPYSAQVLRIPLKEVFAAMLVLPDLPVPPRQIMAGGSPTDDRFLMTADSVHPLAFTVERDAEWIHVTPSYGRVGGGALRLTLKYNTRRLSPGEYNANIIIHSPDALNSPQTVPVKLTVRPSAADLDGDGDVDEEDLARFQACLTGPGVAQQEPDCAKARLDEDTDVDQDDFAILEQCFGGSGKPPGPNCTR